jgi:hypothetical protein
MTNEVWIPVRGYEGSYECSNQGNFRSITRFVRSKKNSKRLVYGITIKQKLTVRGYFSVPLSNNGKVKWRLSHRVVYESFEGPTLLQIDHINDIPTDNRLVNLQPLSHRDNNIKAKARYHKTSKYTGVSAHYRKWKAQIGNKGKKYHLGYFDTQEEAHEAYKKASISLS